MNRRICINCETEWQSVADSQLDAPHTCPRCGDQLVAGNVAVLRPATASVQISHLAA
jgi:predicted RNA-binding Zn-ribbon protein involved in translation (DUF1610 family)